MNRLRVVGLLIAILLATWLVVRSCTPSKPPPAPPSPPAREAFHASKPLQLAVSAQSAAGAESVDQHAGIAWLEFELRHLLTRGKMNVAPAGAPAKGKPFTLQVEVAPDAKQITLALVAPDTVVERTVTVASPGAERLDVMKAIAAQLPQFLGAAHPYADWTALLGTQNAKSYESFVNSAMELSGPDGQGITQPQPASQRSRTVDRLESLTRDEPTFARAWSALATAYLSLGGQDESSLTQLAESSAGRALSLDADLGEAHAALGIVHLRRNDWIAAQEQFERALRLDANDAPALEGFACLLIDAGRHEAARPLAQRALAVQPLNIGARECLEYAGSEEPITSAEPKAAESGAASAPVARVRALRAILKGDLTQAQQQLRGSLSEKDFNQWAAPLLAAARNRRDIPDALQAITGAANDERIDAATEILCGAALRQAEFVFNRMSRLQRQGEPVPFSVLWMPETAFLRRSSRFEEIIGAAGLPGFWQEHGTPDVCATEPNVYGCNLRRPQAQAGSAAHSLPSPAMRGGG